MHVFVFSGSKPIWSRHAHLVLNFMSHAFGFSNVFSISDDDAVVEPIATVEAFVAWKTPEMEDESEDDQSWGKWTGKAPIATVVEATVVEPIAIKGEATVVAPTPLTRARRLARGSRALPTTSVEPIATVEPIAMVEPIASPEPLIAKARPVTSQVFMSLNPSCPVARAVAHEQALAARAARSPFAKPGPPPASRPMRSAVSKAKAAAVKSGAKPSIVIKLYPKSAMFKPLAKPSYASSSSSSSW